MSSRTKGEPRVERHANRIRVTGGLPIRTDPEAAAEAHRVEVTEPLALPRPVFEHFKTKQCRRRQQLDEPGFDCPAVGILPKQGAEPDRWPQGRFARGGLEYGIVGRVLESDRCRAERRQRLLDRCRVGRADIECELEIGHLRRNPHAPVRPKDA
jgi:hypothetical protein